MGLITRGDSMQKGIIERRMEERKGRGRPRIMLLDWMTAGERIRQNEEKAENRMTYESA